MKKTTRKSILFWSNVTIKIAVICFWFNFFIACGRFYFDIDGWYWHVLLCIGALVAVGVVQWKMREEQKLHDELVAQGIPDDD